jgi:ABC-2 type transport system ATP-binding protein
LLAKVSHQVLILESLSVLPDNIEQAQFSCERLDDYSLQVTLEVSINITDVLQSLSKQGISVEHIRSTQNRLETLFLNLTNKAV